MEFLGGTDLCRILCQLRNHEPITVSQYPLARLVELIADACDGFTAAHEQQILHRDIKPENMMIDELGQVHIIDWGVAKPMRELEALSSVEPLPAKTERRRSPRLTQAGQQPGTLLYMSPEQVVGLSQLDPRSDIYSLGAVLYDCLALSPFIAGSTQEEIVNRITSGPQIPPSEVTLRESIPQALEDVCMRALAIDPRDRFETMAQFRDALIGTRSGLF